MSCQQVLRCRDNAFSSCTEVLQYMTQHSSQQPAWQQQLQQPDKLQQQLDQQLQQFTRQAFADTVLPIHQFAAVLCCKVAALILADQTSPQPFTRHLTKRRREWVTQLSQFTFISRVVWRCSNMCRPTAAVLGQQAAQLGPELLQLAYAAPPHCCHTAAMVGSATAAESAVDVRCLLALLCSSNYLQHETADEASILQALTQLLCQPHPGGQLPEQQQGSSNQEYQQPLVDQATVECWLQQQGLIMQALMSAAAEPAVTHHTSCCTLCGVVADSEGQEAVQCGYCCHSYHLSCARDEAMFAAGPEVDPAAAPAGKAKCLGCQGFPWSELGRRHVLYGESVHDALQAASGPAIAAAAAGYAPGATPSRRGRSAGDRNAARAAVRGRAAAYVDHNQATCIGRRSADGSVTDSSPAHFTAPTAAAAAAGSTYRNRSLPFSRKHALYIVGQRAAEKHQDNAAAEDVITGGDAEGKCSRAMSAAAAVGAADGEDDECNWPCQQRGQPAVISTATAPSSEHALRELLQAVVATAAAGRCMPNTAKDLLKYGLLPKGTAIDYIKDRVVLQCFTVRGASGRQQKLQCTTCAATFDSLSACEVHCRGGTTRHASNRLFVHGMEHSLAKLVQHHLPAMRQEVYLQSQQQQQQPGSADVAGCSARPGSTPAADIHGGSRLSMMQQQPVQPTPYPASAASKSPEQEQQEEHEVQRHKPATKRKHPDCADCGVDLCNQQQCIKRWRQALEALQQLLSDNRHTLPELVEQKQQQMQQQAAGPLKQPQQADTGLGGTGNEQWQPAHHCSALTQNSTSMVTLDADDDADVAGEDGEVVQQVHGSDTVQVRGVHWMMLSQARHVHAMACHALRRGAGRGSLLLISRARMGG